MKKIVRMLGVVIVIGIIIEAGLFFISTQPVSKEQDEQIFVVSGNKLQIVKKLKEEGFIKNDLQTLLYIVLTNKNLQAGTYYIDKSESSIDIINQIASGNTKMYAGTIRVMFTEGHILADYAKQIEEKFSNITADDFIKRTKDKSFLKKII